MKILNWSKDVGDVITEFNSRGARARELEHGRGETHVYTLHFDAGGEIGPHPTGFDQWFLVIEGEGWAAGADGERKTIRRGEAARFDRGEVHSKGSVTGMTALMIQVERLAPE